MSIRKDIAANYIGAAVAALAPILAIPWYISILGTEYWGLISFISVLQGVLGLLNVGLGQSLIREFSRLAVDPENGRKKIATVLFGFERIYWSFSLVMAIFLCICANVIIDHWLKLGDIPADMGRMVVYGAAGIFAAQFPVSIYRSVLVGCNGQVTQNVLVASGAVARHAGGVFVLIVIDSISAYLIWNVLMTLIETLVTARFGWEILGVKRSGVFWCLVEIRKLFSFSLGWSLAVMLAILTMQVDKLVISSMLPIEQLGFYAIASAVAMGLLQLFSPIASAALPRIVQLQDQPQVQKRLNLKLFAVMLAIGSGAAVVFLFAGETVLNYWLRDKSVVDTILPVLSMLLVGTAMNAIYNVGYMNWLAAGATSKILKVNTISLGVAVIITPLFVAENGLLGASAAWLVINSVGMFLSLDWLAKGKIINA